MPSFGFRTGDSVFILAEIVQVVLVVRYFDIRTLVDRVIVTDIIYVTPVRIAMYAVARQDHMGPITGRNDYFEYIIALIYGSRLFTPCGRRTSFFVKVCELTVTVIISVPAPVTWILFDINDFPCVEHARVDMHCQT